MAAKLLSQGEGPDLTLDKPVMLLGRHAECDIQLQSGKVSRRHCVIASVDRRLLIRDLGSTNGVRINGERVAEGELKDGDELAVGNFRYVVRVHGSPRQAVVDADLESADAPVPLEGKAGSDVQVARPGPSAENTP